MSARARAAGFRRAFSETLGFRGGRNLAAWGTAGFLAYYIWVVPERKVIQEQKAAKERARQNAIDKGLLDVDRVRPTPDPQDTGLMRGHRPPKDPSL